MTKLEQVARALALENGDDFDAIPKHKAHWNRESGIFQGQCRDINAPFAEDYLAMARAAVQAMMEPSEGMIRAAVRPLPAEYDSDNPNVMLVGHPAPIWRAMLQAILEESDS